MNETLEKSPGSIATRILYSVSVKTAGMIAQSNLTA